MFLICQHAAKRTRVLINN